VVTMAAVARMAGVSPMTVSNVLRGRSSVSPELRERVEAAVRESGYRLNASARTLRSGSSGVIGLAVPEVATPYYAMLGQLLSREARRFDLRVAMESTGADAASEAAAIEVSRSLAYDGLILAPIGLDVDLWSSLSRTLPMVFLGERPAPSDASHVAMPNVEGTRAATELLIARGARRIAFVGPAVGIGEDVLSTRYAGYREALAAAGLAAGDELHLDPGGMETEQARQAVVDSRRGGLRPDAYMAVTDSIALGVLRGLADLGVPVPGEALVVGFDNVREANFSIPSLSTVAPDHEWVARRALELLVERIADHGAPGVQEVAPFTLVERESTGA
jgi:DNA-binding LacI/PurR family transcriptional regulator